MNKTFAIAFAAFLLTSGATRAQEDITAGMTPTSSTLSQADRAALRKLNAERRAQEAIEGKRVLLYGGFLVDLKRAERKSRFLSLRQPLDPKNDYKNVFVSQRPDQPSGFTLFRLGF